jgi:hypothetical protein
MVRPLLTQLRTSIHAENDSYTYNQTDVNIEYDDVYLDEDNEAAYKTEWDNGQECINYTMPNFTVICPENYDKGKIVGINWRIVVIVGMILV